MNVQNEMLSELEALGKIKIDSGQRDGFLKDLNEIIAYADTLSEISAQCAESVMPETPDALRKDEVDAADKKELLLSNTPHKEDGCFAVPKTVD